MEEPNVHNLVPKFYERDRVTEDFITSGFELEEGMTVLIADFYMKVALDVPPKGKDLERALAMNRWCVVTQLERDQREVIFVGIYEDGSEIKRHHFHTHAWFVKKTDGKRNVIPLIHTNRPEAI